MLAKFNLLFYEHLNIEFTFSLLFSEMKCSNSSWKHLTSNLSPREGEAQKFLTEFNVLLSDVNDPFYASDATKKWVSFIMLTTR